MNNHHRHTEKEDNLIHQNQLEIHNSLYQNYKVDKIQIIAIYYNNLLLEKNY